MAARKSLLVTRIAVFARSERARLAPVTDDAARTAPPGDRLDVQVSLSVSTVDAVVVRKGLTAVTKPSREVAWRGPARFAARIHETLAELHQLVVIRDPGCVSLSEHAILCVDKALGQFSPADPDMDALREEVRGLHLDACGAVPPKPEALAARLVELAEKTDHDWMHDAPERYRALLGDTGLAALDAILTRKLAAMPSDSRAALSHAGLTLRAMSESLARALGDIDRLVRELANDLETPARYVRIAHELESRARKDDAVEWLQRESPRTAPTMPSCARRSSRPTCTRTGAGMRSRSCATSSCAPRAPS